MRVTLPITIARGRAEGPVSLGKKKAGWEVQSRLEGRLSTKEREKSCSP